MKPSLGLLKKKFRNGLRSVNFILTFWISLFALAAMLTVAAVMFVKFDRTLTENSINNSAQVVDQVLVALDSYIENTIDVSERIEADINRAYLAADRAGMAATLSTAYRLRDDVASLAVFGDDGELMASAPAGLRLKDGVDVAGQDWYRAALRPGARYAFSPPHVQNLFKGQYNWVVTFSRRINVFDQEDIRGRAVFSIDMNFNSIEENCSRVSIGSRGYVYILGGDGNIIYHPQQQMIYSNIKTENVGFVQGKPDGEYLEEASNRVVVVRSIAHTGWKLVGVSYLEEAEATRREAVRFLAALFAVAVTLVLMIAVVMSRRISRPLVRLTEAMDEVEKGNLNIHSHEDAFYEVSRLRHSFNHMIDRINELLERIKSEEQELRKSELRALQAQINPHFLYNTLGSILWMCERGESRNAVVMVQALANLFRISISKGNEIITVRDELQHAESYLIIQKVRYKDQFEYTLDVDESLLGCRCLKIILQPMIENAIYHGIDRMVDKGQITIRVKPDGDAILMQVIDNGLGMPESVLAGILESESANSYGIGVKNVHHRIQIYFGREYGLRFESELDEGTTVNIRIPRIEGGGP